MSRKGCPPDGVWEALLGFQKVLQPLVRTGSAGSAVHGRWGWGICVWHAGSQPSAHTAIAQGPAAQNPTADPRYSLATRRRTVVHLQKSVGGLPVKTLEKRAPSLHWDPSTWHNHGAWNDNGGFFTVPQTAVLGSPWGSHWGLGPWLHTGGTS